MKRLQHFRCEAAFSLGKRADKPNGLPDSICQIFEKWLSEPWDNSFYEKEQKESESESTDTILWGMPGGEILPNNAYFVLDALTYGYLLQEPPLIERWIKMLEQHLERVEPAATWIALSRSLRWLSHCDDERLLQFMMALFKKYPSVRDSVEGVQLIGFLWQKLPADFLRNLLEEYRTTQWVAGKQANGELLCWWALRTETHTWAVEKLNSWLDPTTATDTLILVGIANTAVEFWLEPDTRNKATEILIQLADNQNKDIAEAIMRLFWKTDNLPADGQTMEILQAIDKNVHLLEVDQIEYLVEHLADYLPEEPGLVFNITQSILQSRGEEVQSIQ